MTAIVKRYPLVTFFGLTYLFLILGWIIFNGQVPYGPLLAAFIVTAMIDGRAGLLSWASHIFRWRVGWQWYVAAIGLPLIATGTGAALNLLLGASAQPIDLAVLPELLPEALFILLFVGLGEEPGFRGFAIPQLQTRFSAITSTLILVVLGVIWHLPLFLTNDSHWVSISVIVTGYFIFTWLFNNSLGSVLIVMIFHTAQAIFGPQIFGAMFSDSDQIRYTLLMALVYGVMLLLVLLTSRNRLLLFRPQAQHMVASEHSAAIVNH